MNISIQNSDFCTNDLFDQTLNSSWLNQSFIAIDDLVNQQQYLLDLKMRLEGENQNIKRENQLITAERYQLQQNKTQKVRQPIVEVAEIESPELKIDMKKFQQNTNKAFQIQEENTLIMQLNLLIQDKNEIIERINQKQAKVEFQNKLKTYKIK
ncbi:hypothetical protein SS50377_22595 [Spironucleus salmonicida]|uniref:Uncharacterized protein n=1 Tax=Spironucleus salmonicida TaxID=348837 RepID=V6LDZ8_9EUKA|nr:hypothetical protein SS50377_22595 [Spironucleus salmonicida]|eukprot:EST41916.1 Hypothetical protein SS50377_18220 [Spironucleus salmonicida]